MYTPIATTHPSVPTATWTKVSTLAGKDRRYLRLVNDDPTNVWRFEMVVAGAAAPVGAAVGTMLSKGSTGHTGGFYEENEHSKLSNAEAWVYQASGGALATLAVTEGA